MCVFTLLNQAVQISQSEIHSRILYHCCQQFSTATTPTVFLLPHTRRSFLLLLGHTFFFSRAFFNSNLPPLPATTTPFIRERTSQIILQQADVITHDISHSTVFIRCVFIRAGVLGRAAAHPDFSAALPPLQHLSYNNHHQMSTFWHSTHEHLFSILSIYLL